MWNHKVYNREDMNVNLGLDYEPNNIDREIDPDFTIREFKNHKKNPEWIKREDMPYSLCHEHGLGASY